MNDIVRFTKGNKNDFIARNNSGKIILSKNRIRKEGYYKITDSEETEKYILANTKRIPYDYYPEIDYDEFLKVLDVNGFKIGFIEDFHYKSDVHEGNEHLIFAYDLSTNLIIVAETWNNGESMINIHLYCPGYTHHNKLTVKQINDTSVLRLDTDDIYDSHKNIGIIHMMKYHMDKFSSSGKNTYNNVSISLWNYSESIVQNMSNNKFIDFYSKTLEKINRADKDDMLKLFKGNSIMLEALK